MTSWVLCLTLALLGAASAVPETRIVGGTPTTIEEFPHILAIVYTYPGPGITIQRCVASLISSWHALTSSFCFTGAVLTNMQIRAGSTLSLSGGILVNVGEVIKHPDYEETPRAGDVAVVFLQTPLGITNTVNILYLPAEGTYIPDHSSLKIVSWGFEWDGGPQLEFLKTVNLEKLNLEECQAIYDSSEDVYITDKVICANAVGRGMCAGDSGAPMVLGQTLVGLSSYFEDCGNDDYPDVFSRVDKYTNWILSVATAPRSGFGPRIAPVQL